MNFYTIGDDVLGPEKKKNSTLQIVSNDQMFELKLQESYEI